MRMFSCVVLLLFGAQVAGAYKLEKSVSTCASVLCVPGYVCVEKGGSGARCVLDKTPCGNQKCGPKERCVTVPGDCGSDAACPPVQSCTLDVCQLDPEMGVCKALFPRYYYSSSDGTCLTFNYGGCEGNGNNFLTLQDCLDYCA